MNPVMILQLIATYGPEILPVIHQVITWIKDGKTEVTPGDIAQLIAYGSKTSTDYLKDIGVPVPPPPTPTPAKVA